MVKWVRPLPTPNAPDKMAFVLFCSAASASSRYFVIWSLLSPSGPSVSQSWILIKPMTACWLKSEKPAIICRPTRNKAPTTTTTRPTSAIATLRPCGTPICFSFFNQGAQQGSQDGGHHDRDEQDHDLAQQPDQHCGNNQHNGHPPRPRASHPHSCGDHGRLVQRRVPLLLWFERHSSIIPHEGRIL